MHKLIFLTIPLILLLAVSGPAVAEDQPSKDATLYEAVKAGDITMVRQLLNEGADVNARFNPVLNVRNKRGHTILMQAAGIGHPEIVRMLLDAGADVNAQTETGWSALNSAAMDGHHDIVRMLLASGENIEKGTALGTAASSGHQEIVRTLLDAGADVNKGEALEGAARHGHHDVVRMLLDAGADVNRQDKYGGTALIAAAWRHTEITRMLLNAGADVNAQNKHGGTALSAASHHHPEIVRMLLDAGADVNKGAGLVAAGWTGQHEIVRTLLKAGADVNVQTPHECTPLFSASLNGHREIVHTLIEAGADVHVLCRDGITAMGATYDPRIIYPLLRAGDSIRHLNERLLWDLTSTLPTLAAILVGIFALIINRKHLRQAAADPQRTQRLANNWRMYRFYLANTAVFLLAYLVLVFFPCSLILQAILAGLFVAAILLMLTNESNKLALPERYTWHPSLLIVGGLAGMGATGLMWFLLHWLDHC